jgi:CHAD domain-containing protein
MAIASERVKLVFRKTERDLIRLVKGHDPEAVHSFRTSTRRLQILIEELASSGDRNDKKLLKMLNRIRRRAGKVRDLDAQLTAFRGFKIPLEPRRRTQLTQRMIELRAKHESKLAKLLKKSEIRDILKRLRRSARAVNLGGAHDPLQVARQMLKSVDHPTGKIREDALHRYRIAVKRARYVAEFAPKSVESAELTAQMKKLQDALGTWHDWLLLTHTAIEQLGEINQSPLVAAMQNVTRSKFRDAISALAISPAAGAAQKNSPTLTAVRRLAISALPSGVTESAA